MEKFKKDLKKARVGVRFNSIAQLLIRIGRDLFFVSSYFKLMRYSGVSYVNPEKGVIYHLDALEVGFGLFVIGALILYLIRGLRRKSFRPMFASYLDVQKHQEMYSGFFINNYLEMSRFGPIEGAWFFFWIHSFGMIFAAMLRTGVGNNDAISFGASLKTFTLTVIVAYIEQRIQKLFGKSTRNKLRLFLDPASPYRQDEEKYNEFQKDFEVINVNTANTLRTSYYKHGYHNPQLHFYRSNFYIYDRKLKQTAIITFYGGPNYDHFELERYGFANTRQGRYMEKELHKTI